MLNLIIQYLIYLTSHYNRNELYLEIFYYAFLYLGWIFEPFAFICCRVLLLGMISLMSCSILCQGSSGIFLLLCREASSLVSSAIRIGLETLCFAIILWNRVPHLSHTWRSFDMIYFWLSMLKSRWTYPLHLPDSKAIFRMEIS